MRTMVLDYGGCVEDIPSTRKGVIAVRMEDSTRVAGMPLLTTNALRALAGAMIGLTLCAGAAAQDKPPNMKRIIQLNLQTPDDVETALRRERCAEAGYYCLYAEYGFVYAYPFDDRPIAHRRIRRAARY